MMKKLLLPLTLVGFLPIRAQIDIQTQNSQWICNVHGTENAPVTGSHVTIRQLNDIIITSGYGNSFLDRSAKPQVTAREGRNLMIQDRICLFNGSGYNSLFCNCPLCG